MNLKGDKIIDKILNIKQELQQYERKNDLLSNTIYHLSAVMDENSGKLTE